MREASVPVIRRGPIGKSVTGEGILQGVKNSLSKGLSVQDGRGRDVAMQITKLRLSTRVSGAKDVTSRNVSTLLGESVGGSDVPLATLSRVASQGSVSLPTQAGVGKRIRVSSNKFRNPLSTGTSSSSSRSAREVRKPNSRRVSSTPVSSIISPVDFVTYSQNRIRISNISISQNPGISSSISQSDLFNPLPDKFSSNMPSEAVKIASNSVCLNTRKSYKSMFQRFISYGNNFGCNVMDFNFSSVFLIGFLLSLYTSRGSIGSILMARASIKFYWSLSAVANICPTESEFVGKFYKGLALDKRNFKPVVKAYPLNYTELEQLFYAVSQGNSFQKLNFVKQRFISLLILAYSSFARFEELQFLKIEDISLIGNDFSVKFYKGKTYKERRLGVVPCVLEKDFNPAFIFGLYYDHVAMLQANSSCSSNYLFPNVRVLKNKTITLNTPISYDNMLKMLKREASLAHLPFSNFKLGMHSLRRGPVTVAVNSGANPLIVKKLMRVQSLSMVDHYSDASLDLLIKASKSAF